MAKHVKTDDSKRLDTIIGLLQHLVAIELWKNGVKQVEISNRLGIASGTVNKFVKDVSRQNS